MLHLPLSPQAQFLARLVLGTLAVGGWLLSFLPFTALALRPQEAVLEENLSVPL